MKKAWHQGLIVTIAAATLVSCTQESVMGESTPQVTNTSISLTFFEQSMIDIGGRTRANSGTALQACHAFSELEVALIPVGKEVGAGYIIRQDSLGEDFGKVAMQVPAGDYHLVAVAANINLKSDKHIDIKSCSEVHFPDDSPTDMVYAYKDITVKSSVSEQSFSTAMTRGVSALILQATEYTPLYVASEEIEIKSGCGTVFNPSTGTCKEETPVTRIIPIDAKKYQNKTLFFTTYVFLKEADLENIQVSAITKNKNGKVVRSLSFDDVHLVKGKKTTYTGKLFSNGNNATFTVDTPQWEKSGYDVDF